MNVYLIGDSIRMNSEAHVRQRLNDLSIISPPENCESSAKVRERIGEWVPATTRDIVHINCGLHDIRYNPGSDCPVSTLHEYESNLHYIFDKLAKTGCHVIWATCTPIDERLHNTTKESRRYAVDLVKYNDKSVYIATKFGFSINDLHSLVSAHGAEDLLLPDGLHFNAVGNELIGSAIASAIRQHSESPNNSFKPTPLRGAA